MVNFQQLQSNIIIGNIGICFCPPHECKSHSLALFLASTMFTSVFLSLTGLLVGDKQIVCDGLIWALKIASENYERS